MTITEFSTVTSSVRSVEGAEVLIIDKDARVRDGMSELLGEQKLNVTAVDDPAEAWPLLDKRFFSVVVADLDSPTPNAGVETVASVQVMSPTTTVLVLTPRKSYDDALAAIRAGAVDVVHKSPDSVGYLKSRVVAAAAASQEKRALATLLTEVRDAQEQFLRRFMEAERRTTDLEDQLAGRNPATAAGNVRLLLVAQTSELVEALREAAPEGYEFDSALTGGEALDRCSSSRYHMLLVADPLPDLPASMVVRTAVDSNPETLAMTFVGPGEGGYVRLADSARPLSIVPEFTDPQQLVSRLDELAEAFRAKERERRYTQAFRERHYDFVRKYVRVKQKVDRALSEASF